MIIYRFTTYNKDGKAIHIYTTSARKAEEYLEKYSHMQGFYGSHVFGQIADAYKIENLKLEEEEV